MIVRLLLAAVAIVSLLGSTASAALAVSFPAASPTAVANSEEATSGASPLVVVLDLSGSMNDDDGAGVIKLTGAKKAVDRTISDLVAGQQFGVWTYPGGSDDCSPGGFAISPGPVTDRTGAIATVDGLTADGGTPTGPALTAAADALRAQGASSATLVLVSDGESNCGQPPCDVAKNLVSQGFDVTVHAVGFRVSDAGREELSCVTGATGGAYVDASDSGELTERLRELTRATLRVQTTAQLVQAGSSASITVTVTNLSSITASDVRVLLELEDGSAIGVNPLLRVGNVPPAGRVQRTWSVGFATQGMSAQPDADQGFTMSAWAVNADRVSTNGTIRHALTDSGAASFRDQLGDWLRDPLEAGHPIVIMGDSYSSGEGTFTYEDVPAGVSPDCHRSASTYLAPQLEPGDLINLACSGAVTWDFLDAGRAGTPRQLLQLEQVAPAPSAVVMTLGGNDIGFADIIADCVFHSCDASPTVVASRLSTADWMRTWLRPIYEDVWTTLNTADRVAQRDGETAPVIVLAYPQVTHATKYGACGELSALAGVKGTFGAGEVAVANQLAARLNAAIKAAVADARADGYEIYFVGDTADMAQPNHTLCDEDRYINDIVGAGEPESIHPTVDGYAAESGIIITWSARLTREVGSRTVGNLADRSTSEQRRATLKVRVDSLPPHVTWTPISDDAFHLNALQFGPNSPVTITAHSTPVVLKTVTADGDGTVDATVRLPQTLTFGAHHVVLTGTDEHGEYRQVEIPITVLAAPPPWVSLGLPIAGALLVGSLILLAFWWRGRCVQ